MLERIWDMQKREKKRNKEMFMRNMDMEMEMDMKRRKKIKMKRGAVMNTGKITRMKMNTKLKINM